MKVRDEHLKLSKREYRSVLGRVDRWIPIEDVLFAGFALTVEARRTMTEARENFEDTTSTFGPELARAAGRMRELGAEIMAAYDPDFSSVEHELASL